MRWMAILVCLAALGLARAGEEKIRGVLEKTAKPEACAQISDALNELYYVAKSDAAEKMIANYVGKNQRVVLTGMIESKPNDSVPYINLKTVEPYAPKMPPAPPPPPPPPPTTENKDEPKKLDEKKPDDKKQDEKKPDEKKSDGKTPPEKTAEEKKPDDKK